MRVLPKFALLLVCSFAAACADAVAAEPAPHDVGARVRPPMPRPPVVAPAPARVELTSGAGSRLPTFEHDGRTYVLGSRGDRYKIRVHNPTGERVEAVISVDGLDAVDGRPASKDKRGYVIEPFGTLDVEGFRTSMSEVAAFRFSSVRDSYASRKGKGENVGVVGVLLFRERPRPVIAPRGDAPAAPAPGAGAPSDGRARAAERPGLGTGFGERRSSAVVETSFERASDSPASRITLRYDDREGLIAAGVLPDTPRDPEVVVRHRAEPFPADRRFAEPPP